MTCIDVFAKICVGSKNKFFLGRWGKFTPKSITYIGDTIMKQRKQRKRGWNAYARMFVARANEQQLHRKEWSSMVDVLERQLAESNKEKRITTKTVTHN